MKQILAMGGHGFDRADKNDRLGRYLVSLADVDRPRICFLAQASAEHPDTTLNFYRAALRWGAEPTDLSLFKPATADLAGVLHRQHIIYVSGGNTKSMLALWREWGLDEILRSAWEQGVILAGPSAGAICWFEQGSTDSIPGDLTALHCLGFLPGSCCPHYDGEAERRPSFRRMVAAGAPAPAYAIDDDAALHFVGSELSAAVAARAGAGAYRLAQGAAGVCETQLEMQLLPA